MSLAELKSYSDENVIAFILSSELPKKVCMTVSRIVSATDRWSLCEFSTQPTSPCYVLSAGGLQQSIALETNLLSRGCIVHAFDSQIDGETSWLSEVIEAYPQGNFHTDLIGNVPESPDFNGAVHSLESISDIFFRNGNIAVLKLDCVDGCEWSTNGLLHNNALNRVDQLLVHFDFSAKWFSIPRAAALFRQLRGQGFEVFARDISPWGVPVAQSEGLVNSIRRFAGEAIAKQYVGTRENMLRLTTEAGFGYSNDELESLSVEDQLLLCCYKIGFIRTSPPLESPTKIEDEVSDNLNQGAADALEHPWKAQQKSEVDEVGPYPHMSLLKPQQPTGTLTDTSDIIIHRLLLAPIDSNLCVTKEFKSDTGPFTLCTELKEGTRIFTPPSCLMYSIGAKAPDVDTFVSKSLGCEVHVLENELQVQSWQHAVLAQGDARWHTEALGNFTQFRLSQGHGNTIIDVLKIDTNQLMENGIADSAFDGVRQVLLTLHLGYGITRVATLLEKMHSLGFETVGWAIDPWSTPTDRSQNVMGQLRELIGAELANRFSSSEESLKALGEYYNVDWDRSRHPDCILCCYRITLFRRNIPGSFSQISSSQLLTRPSLIEPFRPPTQPTNLILFNFQLAIDRVVLSFTTIPSRVGLIGPVLLNVKLQSFHVDAIYVHLPKKMQRFDTEFVIPSFLKDDPHVIVNWIENDFGPSTKLLGALMVEKHPSTVIITIDDDFAPYSDFVNNLLNGVKRFPEAAIGFGGWNVSCALAFPCARYGAADQFYGNLMFIRQGMDSSCSEWNVQEYGRFHCARAVTNIDHPEPTDVLEGYMGIAYRRGFFDDAIFNDYSKAPPESFFVDDVWISGHLAMRGVQRLVVFQNREMKQPNLINDRKLFEYQMDPDVGTLSHENPDSLHGTVGNFVDANRVMMQYFRSLGVW
jgi:hypothetical protein